MLNTWWYFESQSNLLYAYLTQQSFWYIWIKIKNIWKLCLLLNDPYDLKYVRLNLLKSKYFFKKALGYLNWELNFEYCLFPFWELGVN